MAELNVDKMAKEVAEKAMDYYLYRGKTIREWIAIIAKNAWIPVSERLPERHKEVIVTDIETSDTYQSQYIGNGYWECDNGILKNRIIAWMPLPEPYKERANENRI